MSTDVLRQIMDGAQPVTFRWEEGAAAWERTAAHLERLARFGDIPITQRRPNRSDERPKMLLYVVRASERGRTSIAAGRHSAPEL